MTTMLERAASAKRTTVAAMIVEAIERNGGVERAAKEIGVSKPIVWRWLSDNGYRVVTGHWAKVIPPAPAREVTVASDTTEVYYEPVEE